MAATFDPYHKWLGIPPHEQPPNHYRLLGILPFESDSEVIQNAGDQRIRHVRSFQLGAYSAESQRLLNEIAAACSCLLVPETKNAYDDQLAAVHNTAIGAATPPPIPQNEVLSLDTATAAYTKARLDRGGCTSNTSKRSKFTEVAKLLAGGSAGIAIGAICLWYCFHLDPFRIFGNADPPEPSTVNAEVHSAGEPETASKPRPPDIAASYPSWTESCVLALDFNRSSRFEEGGHLFVRDLSGQGPPGRSFGSTFVPGVNDEALSVTNTGQFVQIPRRPTLAPPKEITLSVCVRPTSFPSAHWKGSIISCDHWRGNGYQSGYVLRCGGNGDISWTASTGRWQDLIVPAQLKSNVWRHVVCVYDQTSQRLYVDGQLAGKRSSSGAMVASSTDVRIGAGAFASDRRFFGDIDEVAVWNRALSDREISELSELVRRGTGYCGQILKRSNAAANPAPQN